MKVTVKDSEGTVRAYEFIIEEAAEMFLRSLPTGWSIIKRAA